MGARVCYGFGPMSSTTRLLVLGVVRIFQPVHGYVVRRELVSWRAQEWASIKPGSIYNALKTLTQDGLLEVVGTDQVGGRPERTTYRLTSVGDQEFRVLLREEWWTLRSPIDPLMAALSFLSYVKREEAIAALQHRTAQIHGLVRHLEIASDELDGVESPWHVREMHLLLSARMLAEVGWAEKLIERLRKGEYSTGDDPPWEPASESNRPQAIKAGRAGGTPGAPIAEPAASNGERPRATAARAKAAARGPRAVPKPASRSPRRKPAR